MSHGPLGWGSSILQTPRVLPGLSSLPLGHGAVTYVRNGATASAWQPQGPGMGRGEHGFRVADGPPYVHPPLQGQNGDSHHCGDRLPLPVRSRKYQEGLDAADRRPREGSHSPLDSADVRVQVPRMVGNFLGSTGALVGPPPPTLGGRPGRPLQGAEVMALAVPWDLVGTGPANCPGHSVQGQC